jgi:hypothetical protein
VNRPTISLVVHGDQAVTGDRVVTDFGTVVRLAVLLGPGACPAVEFVGPVAELRALATALDYVLTGVEDIDFYDEGRGPITHVVAPLRSAWETRP